MSEEKDIVYSNPVKIDDERYEVDKTSTITILKTSLLADKEMYEAKLLKINKILAKLETLG